ncbi:oxidoreductase [Nocardioides sp. ChNu-153]|uniref:FAD-dependent oxidoreductase n=1 Tax=Nocardioides sp. ChNu-153 TaxID=2779364 RepID=UPI002652C463|nr:hypothetical protein [Nocardioides sp. ChNu-153]MDN7122685.1 oxidoreductase [Nocardioides sp. ChNu-153]
MSSSTTSAPAPRTGGSPLARVDAALGRVPMYRVVSLALGALVLVSFFLAITRSLLPSVFRLEAMALTLVVLVGVSVVANALLGLAFRVRAHTESAVITGLLLWFLYWPTTDTAQLAWLAATAVLANASKYLLAVRGRHVLNPAAAGVVLVLVVQELASVDPAHRVYTTWWIANEPALVPLVLAALVVLWRTRRLDLGLLFVALAGVLVVLGLLNSTDLGAGTALEQYVVSSPAIFLAGFMLSEPLTLPPRRAQRLGVAALAAFVFAWPQFQTILLPQPVDLWVFESTAELALLASGAVAFVLGQRGGVRLRHTGTRRVGAEVWELRFAPRRPVRFRPGQYVELALPHRGSDRRGVRRVFSIVSPSDDPELAVALRVPEPSSSYKKALLALEPGAVLGATGVGGDFVLPRRPGPVVLVAGGIGITPFLSWLRSPEAEGLDAVLVLGVPDADDVAYRDELVAAGVPVVLVAPGAPADLPPGWRHLPSAFLTADVVVDAVPDLGERTAYVSGPPAMVTAVAGGLRRRARKVRTDSFAGY